MSTPRYMQAGVPQSSVLSPTLYNLYINDTPQTPGVNLALFGDDACLYATDRKEGYVLFYVLSPGVKQQRREAYRSPFSAEVIHAHAHAQAQALATCLRRFFAFHSSSG
jgi:hypothetical protein